MACRGSQTASIRFLGGSGLAGGGVASRYQDHVLQTLTSTQGRTRNGAAGGQAKQQLSTSASTIDRAMSDLDRASTNREVSNAIMSAQRALDQARRAGTERDGKELLALERKVQELERNGQAKAQQLEHGERGLGQPLTMPVDPLSRSRLGVATNRTAAPQARRPQGPTSPVAPPESARVLQTELDALRSGEGSRQELGDFSEAVAAGLTALVQGHSILQQHHPGAGPHGLDIQSLDAAGKVWAFEVKGTRVAGKSPAGTRYEVGRQGSAEYVADRSRSSPLSADVAAQVGGGNDQLGSLLVQVNVTDDQVSVWELDPDGSRAATPLEVYRLEDVVHIVDAS